MLLCTLSKSPATNNFEPKLNSSRKEIKLNNNCVFKKIDFNITNTSMQPYTGKTSLGIYKIEEGILTIVAGEPGRHMRPLSFREFENAIVYIFVRG